MSSVLTSAIRSGARQKGEPLNIALIGCTHERYETGLAKTGHRFWSTQGMPGMKTWDSRYAPVPEGYSILDGSLGDKQVPIDVPIDLVMSQTRQEQFRYAQNVSIAHNCPHITLEHVLPVPHWPAAYLASKTALKGHVNVFISEYSRDAWGYGVDNSVVIEHGVDLELFKPLNIQHRWPHCLSVVNEWERRDAECGFTFWKKATAGFPTMVLGDNPGFSRPAGSLVELSFHYATSRIFVNTSQISPIPTTLLEAMACGCAVVTTSNPMIETIIQHGVNGLIANDPDSMRNAIQFFLDNEGASIAMGENARNTIEQRFSMERFVSDWRDLFEQAANFTLKGGW